MSSRMIRRVGASVLAPVLVVSGTLIVSAPTATAQLPAGISNPTMRGELSDSEINRSLDYLARQVAGAAANHEFRQIVHDAIGKRFDGDTEALWSSLAENPTFNRGITRRAAGSARSKRAQRIADVASDIPRLQIAVPEHFESWNPVKFQPLVAYFPVGVDDTTVKTLTAYDSQGNSVLLDAQVAPKQPVIVLGLNERTDEEGTLTERSEISFPPPAAAGKRTAAARRASESVYLYHAQLKDDKEPWVLGDAEISYAVKSRGCSAIDYQDYNVPNLNNDGDGWSPNKNLGSTTCDVVFKWWEDDGGSSNYTLSFAGFSLGVGMDNDDDEIGGVQLDHSTFIGASTDVTTWTALWMATY